MEQIVIINENSEIEDVLQKSKQFGLYKITSFSFNDFKEELHLGFIKGCLIIKKCRFEDEFVPLIMKIRRVTKVPIILLVDHYDSYEAAISLEAGADDYLVYPVHPRDLSARIKAIMRRSYDDNREDEYERTLYIGDLSINLRKEEVLRSNKRIDLNNREYAIFLYLIKNAGEIVTREELMDAITVNKNIRLIDIYIHGLRSKIEELPNFPKYIRTIKGKGYRFEAD